MATINPGLSLSPCRFVRSHALIFSTARSATSHGMLDTKHETKQSVIGQAPSLSPQGLGAGGIKALSCRLSTLAFGCWSAKKDTNDIKQKRGWSPSAFT